MQRFLPLQQIWRIHKLLGAILSAMVLTLSLLGFIGCGKKKDDNIKIFLIPKSPILIETDAEIATGSLSDPILALTGPFFRASFLIENDSDRQLTIMGAKFFITGIRKDGSKVVVESKELDLTVLRRSYLATILPGNKFPTSTAEQIFIYVDSLPKAQDVVSLIFKGELKLMGWYGDPGTPEKSFKRSIFFTTSL